jgi:hypothetical protein
MPTTMYKLNSMYLEILFYFESETEGARGQPQHRVAPATPWPRHQVVWTPGPPPDIVLLAYIFSSTRKNSEGPNSFPKNILQTAAIVDMRSGGSRSSSRHRIGEGNHHRRPSSSPCLPLE